jgi:hypothetical protein
MYMNTNYFDLIFIDSPVLNYCLTNTERQFIKINTQSEEFKT